jgi:amino acid adenylation domain-containing protein
MSRTPEPQDRLKDLSAEQRAALVRTLREKSARRTALASIPRRPADRPAPLSFAQQRQWFLDRLSPGAPVYHMARALRLRGRLVVEALERSLNEIVRRHEILRTTFAEAAEGPVQVVAPSLVLRLPVVDLDGLPADRREAEVARRTAEEARRPFDLGRGPLLRTLLLRLAEDEHVFIQTQHHIVGDGWSAGVFDRELAAIYEAFAEGRPSLLPDPPIQYGDFAHWQRRRFQGEELRALVDFWRRRLEGAPGVLDLPLDRQRPPAPTYGGARVSFDVPSGLVGQLKALARAQGATSFMVLLAAFLALLNRWSGQDDLCVGTPVAGRTRLETESLIGLFVNTLVVRGDVSGDPTLLDLVRRVRGAVGEALGHQEAPFEKLVEELRPKRDPSLHPLFQTMFVLQDVQAAAPDLCGLRSELIDFEAGVTPFDLTVVVSEDSEGMEALLEYATDIFERATVERMAGDFRALLEALAADPARRLSEVPLSGLGDARNATRRDAGRAAARGLLGAPAPGAQDAAGPAPFLPPRTDTERALARIWTEVLGRDRVGVHDDFFEAGGHSLLVLQLVSRVREALRIDVPALRVFETPALGALAEWIDSEGRSGQPFDRDRIELAARDAPLPVSFAQKRLWFIDQLRPGSAAYNVPLALRLRGRLDADALERSLEAIVDRHEALRTVFRLVDGEPVQVIRPAGPSVLSRVDLAGGATVRREAEALRLAEEEGRTSFDLARGPLFRARLLRLNDEDHVLFLTLHHIVSDGWSLGVLLRELQALYEGFVAGRPVLLPDLPIQYADYAAWERRRLQGEAIDAQVAYWRRRLAGAPATLDLPFDRPRPRAATFRGAWRPLRVARGLTEAMGALARREGTTLFAVLLAAFQALLCRYSGQDDLCVGTPVAGRNRLELEPLIGYFINTLVLRGDLSGDPSFRELVGRAREVVLGAQTHQDLPFERLVEMVSLPRDPARQPLFQVALVMQNMPVPDLRLPGLSVEPLDIDTGTAKFDLTLQVAETDDGLAGSIEYSTDLFDAATIDRMIGHFGSLLEGAAADPDRRLSSLPLLTGEERRDLLAAADVASSPAAGTDGTRCLHELFEARAVLAPDAPALTFEGESLDYGRLNARADRLARLLRARGVGPETMVGVCLDRSPEMVVAILAVLKAGGAYVPLDPTYPRDRLAFILDDTRARVVLTRGRLRDALPPPGAGQGVSTIEVETIDVDAAGAGLEEESAEPLAKGALPDHPAYVIYTSGSTGRPKGIVVTHRNVARLFEATRAWFEFGPLDVWTLFHSYAFDFSVWEMWGALLHGGRLVVVPFLVSRSPEAFLRLLREERVTVLNQTPSAFRLLMHADAAASTSPAAPDLALRLVIFGGEALEPAALRPWFERHGDRRPHLVNMYGITETTVHVTCRPLSAADLERPSSPIGRPIPDLSLHVLDQRMEPAPYGVPGEIYVGGEGLARGYLGRPELTAERFVPDPFAGGPLARSLPGARLYLTGDLGRRRADGEIEYLGRVDDQVKIRGFRIEPGEIEATLSRCPGVRQAVVVARRESSGERRLVAYVVPAAEAPGLDALRVFLMERLPDYMIPGTFLYLESLPLTPSGKIDRRALPAPERARPDLEDRYVAPRTPEEKHLAEVWCEVLGLDKVGIDDNFFALGGDSIRSIQVRVKAGERGLDLSLQQIFDHQTIRGLASDLARALPEARAGGRPGPFELVSPEDRRRLPADVEDAYPLSKLQEGFVFHSEYSPDYIIYVSSVEIRAPFLGDRLATAVRRMVARHPILRTSFDLTGFSEPLQLVHREAAIPIALEDLSRLSPSERDRALVAWVEEEMRRRFDWGRAPLVRLHVHLLGEERFQLTLSEPFFDGWSVATFLTELLEIYSALIEVQAPPPGPPLRSSYRDFVALEREALRSSAVREFWAGIVADATATRLPRREGARRDPGALPVCRVDVPLTQETSAALQRLAWSAGVPLKSVLLAAHMKVVSLLSGRRDVVTGLIANGRPEEPDGEKVLGIFLNTLPFRLRLPGGTWVDLARRAFEAEREMLPYRRFPMVELQRLSGGQFLSDAAFNYTNFHIYRRLDRQGSVDLWGGYGFEQTYFALTAQFNLDESSATVSVALDYRSADLAREQVEEIADHYARVLAAMAQDPAARHERLDALTEDERRRVLVEWNDTRRDWPLDRRVHDPFEAQVARTPEAIAVVDGTVRLTYLELNRRANQVAHRLRRLGIAPEALVAVCLPRTQDLIVALLGILKAGGAYVPLDPAYPRQRLAFTLEDTRAPVLVTLEDLLGAFPPHAARVLCLDRDRAALECEPGENPPGGALPGNLAYVIYTSGSTGRPKGAAIEHQSTVSLLHWARETLTDEDRSGVLASSSVCFDSSVLEIFGPLSWGGKLILAENALSLPALPARDEVRLVNTVPSAFAELLRLGGVPDSVRTVSLAGEALPGALVRRIHEQATIERVINLYGLSEATVYSTIARLRRGEETGATPIGRPVSNTRIYILDEDGNPVPPWVPGEIVVGGVGPGRGYLDRPDLTAERFVPDPFAGEPGARMYRTGDLGRFRSDGTIDFLGRIDQQVKIRGFRIEPGEIEAVLSAHPKIAEAVVQVREEADGDRRLVAYVVPKVGPASLSLRELRRDLAGKLPEHMLPAAFVPLEALPRTPNGKLDRKALPAPGPSRLRAEGTYVAPVTPDEKKLARLWARVLGVEAVGLNDNFFEAGGHSLLATQLVSRLRAAFRVELPLRALFEAPTVAGMVQAIERLRSAGGGRRAPALRRRPRGGALPLSFAQQRLWFLDRLEPGCAFYNLPAAMRLRGPLDIGALRRALNEIVRRHEALRTTFRTVQGEPEQVIVPALEPELPVESLEGLPAAEREVEARRRATIEARALFDLKRGPLARASLLRLAAQDHVLLLTTHHIVSDGWSMNVFLRELAQIYGAFRDGRPSPLSDPDIQYADFAAWQRDWLRGDVLRGQIEYWKKRLAGAPTVLDLPADRPRPPAQTYRGARHPFALPKDLSDALRDVGRRQGTTLFMTLLAGFQALLFRYTGQEQMLIGSPSAGRDRAETEGLIGFFVNTLVLRGDLSGDPSFARLLARTREDALGAYAHQDLPFEKLVESVQPDRDLTRAPLFQVMFALQPPAEDVPDLPGLTMQYMEVDPGTSQFDLTLSLSEDVAGLAGAFEYSTDLFDEERIARMARHLETLLRAAADDPARRVSALPLLAPAERRTILVDWSGAAEESPRGERTVLDRFEAQAARSPGTPAVVRGDARLTYADLDRRADRLARDLRALGIGPGTPVAVCLERSPDFLVAILGIMKAGGAYVPLDPSYPREWLDFTLQDIGSPLLLTHGRLQSSLHLRAPRVVCLDGGEGTAGEDDVRAGAPFAEAADAGAGPAGRRPGPHDPAYVIYTSGSTGRPKGVLVTHANLEHSTAARLRFYRDPVTGFILLPSFAFDSSVAGIFWTLSSGGTLVLPPQDFHEDPRLLLEWIARQRPSHWLSVPSLYAYVLAQARPEDLAPLRTVIVAGETCPPDLVERHRELAPGAALFNEYGPTEGTVWSTVHECGASLTGAGSAPPRVPIGRPIPGTRVYLLDRNLDPVPAGVAGELYIGGEGVAAGYLRRPDLSAAVFVPDPFGGEPGARLYRTGDAARFLPDGNLEFLGRSDDQVKLRGYRIEPGEIEAVLAQHMYVQTSAVVVQEPVPGDRRLVAFVVPEPGEVVLAGDLRSFLKQKLPPHMVPSAIVALESLPLTANGKIDRRALQARPIGVEATAPAAVARPAGRASAPAPPRDDVERRLAAIWEEVLSVRPVGVDESFFDLGGHSMLTVRLMARVESEFGRSLPLSILFRGGTIANLADALRSETAPAARPPLVALAAGGSKLPFYCVHPIGGTVLCYGALAARLGADRPFFALEAPGLRVDTNPQSTVEALAERYLAALREQRPRGPYALGGWSFGGVVAYEMACRLAAQREPVALLALIDSHAPGSLPASASPVDGATLVAMLARELGGVSGGLESPAPGDDSRLPESDGRLDRILERAKAQGLLPPEIGLEEVRRLVEVLRANLRALRGYLPGSYPGRATLFRAAQAQRTGPDPAYGWRALALGGVDVLEVPGDHYSMVREPHVQVLAERLRARLQDAASAAIRPAPSPAPSSRADSSASCPSTLP